MADVPLTVHGLRHTWAAERYLEITVQGASDYAACKLVSEWLSHERADVTRIYLASVHKSGDSG